MVKNFRFRITVDNRGKITCGKKREGSEIPQSLDYFDVSDFPELGAWYGPKPKRLLIYFPTDTVADFFDTAFNAWYTSSAGKKGKKRSCDGETCLHYIDEEINGKQYAAGEETECICKALEENDKKRCRYDCYLKAYIGNPENGKIENPCCYMFTTHSDNSADGIYSELEKIKLLNMGVLRMIPFELSVAMHDGPAGKRYPIISLRVWGLLTQIREASKNFLGGLPAPFLETQKGLPAPVEVERKVACDIAIEDDSQNPPSRMTQGDNADESIEQPPLPWEKGKQKLIEEALKVIKDGEAAVTSWALGTNNIKKGQTWRDLSESSLKTIIKSGEGFMKMISKWIDNNQSKKK